MSMQSVRASPWHLTPHSEVGFHIDTFGMTFVKGQFEKVQSTLQFDLQQPEQATAEVILDITSIDLNKPSFKQMVLGPDLFYVEKYKTATFTSTQFKALGDHRYQILGNLTLRGVTRPILFNARLVPNLNNPDVLDVEAYTIIHRSDFGMKKALGGIGEKVNIQVIGQWKKGD
ncbi:YceI family protein [Acinetobacter sp. ANC 4173]|uniref:YceI family protein n=1 Tax=Acinetobacter sp. ANC 4173 TaxID=2529837 RepID=UPI001D0DBA51|nr:YceI family protein [Acinetobacter sp. ANC 4173]